MSYTARPDGKLAGVAASTDPKDKMYEPKHKKKLVRVLTVVAYVFSVSLAAITLSLFYIFIYNPEKPATRLNTRSLYGNNTPHRLDDDRFLNRTWMAPEEPRALPVQFAKTDIEELTGGLARFHSDSNEADSWESSEAEKTMRSKRAVLKTVLKALKRNKTRK